MNVINFNAVVQSSRSHMTYVHNKSNSQTKSTCKQVIYCPYTCNTTLIDKVECIYGMYYSVTVNKIKRREMVGFGDVGESRS